MHLNLREARQPINRVRKAIGLGHSLNIPADYLHRIAGADPGEEHYLRHRGILRLIEKDEHQRPARMARGAATRPWRQ